MPKFYHTYSIAFTVESDDENAKDVTPAAIKAALAQRVEDVFDNVGDRKDGCKRVAVRRVEWEEVCGW